MRSRSPRRAVLWFLGAALGAFSCGGDDNQLASTSPANAGNPGKAGTSGIAGMAGAGAGGTAPSGGTAGAAGKAGAAGTAGKGGTPSGGTGGQAQAGSPSAGQGGAGGEGGSPPCQDLNDRYLTEVYPVAMQICQGCHAPGGVAQQPPYGVKFLVEHSAYPDFSQHNVDLLRTLVKDDSMLDDLLQKPLGNGHVGGAVLAASSPGYLQWASFLDALRNDQGNSSCPTPAPTASRMSRAETFRKAALLLAARLPTDAELAQLPPTSDDPDAEKNSEQALHDKLVDLTRSEPFYQLLAEAWNDILQIHDHPGSELDSYNQFSGINASPTTDQKELLDAVRGGARKIDLASANQEPLKLIEYVVRHDRDFREVLTAEYVVANPVLAYYYSLGPIPPLHRYPSNSSASELLDACNPENFAGQGGAGGGGQGGAAPSGGQAGKSGAAGKGGAGQAGQGGASGKGGAPAGGQGGAAGSGGAAGKTALCYDFFYPWEAYPNTGATALTQYDQLPGLKNLLTSHPVPVSGILTTPAFLNSWRSTPTNRARLRTSLLFRAFLGTDILKTGRRSLDPAELMTQSNPILHEINCQNCHARMDPIAGAYWGYTTDAIVNNAANDAYFDQDEPWYHQKGGTGGAGGTSGVPEMLAPGYGTDVLPEATTPEDKLRRINWMASRLANDPRFAVGVAQVMFRTLVGEEPLEVPEPPDNPSDTLAAAAYRDAVVRFRAQREWFSDLTSRFRGLHGYNLRHLVADIVQSDYFRDRGSPGGASTGDGRGRLLTPEMLGRKLFATTGGYFHSPPTAGQVGPGVSSAYRLSYDDYRSNSLATHDFEWRRIYGGTDTTSNDTYIGVHIDTPTRLTAMTPLMLAASTRIAASAACRSVFAELLKDDDRRVMLHGLSLTDSPADASRVPAIKEAIRALHWSLWGERVEVDSAEVQTSFALLEKIHADRAKLDPTDEYSKLYVSCGLSSPLYDFGTAVTQEAGIVHRPPSKLTPPVKLDPATPAIVNAWNVLLTYMLSDFRFTHE